MAEPTQEAPYKNLRYLYGALNDGQKNKFISKLEHIIGLVKGGADLAHLVSDLTSGYVFGEILGIGKENENKEDEYKIKTDETQEGGV